MDKAWFVTLPLLLSSFSISCFSQDLQKNMVTIEESHSIIVSTKDGFVRGIAEPDLAIFLGIPYAAPPIDNLRWKSPAEPKSWSDTLATLAYGYSCPQRSKDNDPTSEDCLYLNVFTTTGALNKHETKRPVMVWIHGGGFLHGSAKGYDGRVLAKKGAVVVTINYRLGPFGYLCHPALEVLAENKGAGNYGLLDQIAALKWVKQNIAAFGGDPNNVSIWGESAGAFSVGALLASPLARGLFNKAILESGTGLINGIQNKESATQYAIAGAETLGIEGSDASALKKLYALSAEQLVEMYTRPKRPQLQGFYVWFSPVVDGWALPLPLNKAIDQDKWNKVPLLLGSNMNEGAYFQREKPTTDIKEYYSLLGDKSLGDTSGLLQSIYSIKDTTEILAKSQEVVGDFGFGAPARALARLATFKNDKVFLYYFTRTSKDSVGGKVKALHSTELPFVFGYTLDKWIPYKRINGINQKDVFIANAISNYWVNFAKYGNPNGNVPNDKLLKWPAYDAINNSYMELGEQMKPMTNLRKVQFDAIDQFSKQKGEIRY